MIMGTLFNEKKARDNKTVQTQAQMDPQFMMLLCAKILQAAWNTNTRSEQRPMYLKIM